MLEIFLNWIFIALVSYGWAYFLPGISVLRNLPGLSRFFAQSLLGLLVMAWVLSVMHFFVSLTSVYVLIILTLPSLIQTARRRELGLGILVQKSDILIFIFALVVLMRATGPIGSQDSGSYHLPYIQWLESMSIVDGLANVHSRFGFNYHYHLLVAFLGLQDFASTTLHSLNGYIYLSIGMVLWGFLRDRSSQEYQIFYAAMFFVLALITNGMNSFSPDFPVAAYEMLLISILIYARGQGQREVLYLLLLIASIALVPLKLSSFTLVLVILCAGGYRLLFSAQIWQIFGIGLLVAGTYLWRNYHLSGYLIYPLSAIDVVSPIWKVPREIVDFEKVVVRNYALGMDLYYSGDVKWNRAMVEQWLQTTRTHNTASYYGLFLLIFDIIIILTYSMIGLFKPRRWDPTFTGLFVGILLALVFWWDLGPDLRFVYGYLAVLTGMSAHALVKMLRIGNTSSSLIARVATVAAVVLGLVGVWGLSFSSGLDYGTARDVDIVYQTPYPSSALRTLRKQGHIIYKTDWDQGCWEAPLPCSYERDDFRFIDPNDMARGFLPAESTEAYFSQH